MLMKVVPYLGDFDGQPGRRWLRGTVRFVPTTVRCCRVGFPRSQVNSVCWDPLQTLRVQDERSESVVYYYRHSRQHPSRARLILRSNS